MMLKYNFIYELKLLLRSRWIQLLSILLLALFGFAAFNGKQKVEKRKTDIETARLEVKASDETMLKLLDSVEQGLEVSASRWTIPTSPMAVGNYHPRVAAMEPAPLAFLATGQGDMFTHYVKPTVSGDDFMLNFTEMTSPVQLLFGSFDLAFVIVYLLPLIIIAFSYNVLSSEKESGSLRLLASQPVSVHIWVLQKLGLRFFWLSILVVLSLTLVFLISGMEWSGQTGTFLVFIGLILCYMLFWFSLTFVVNLWIGNSARNSVTLLGMWVLFVLLMPSVLNQLGSALYPMPSRTLLINDMRVKKAEATQKQDEILDNFLRDHPEYAINDPSQSRSFWHRYMASQKLVKEELDPLLKQYNSQLEKQQYLLGQWQWVSPAIVMQRSLNQMAGTSTRDYEDFREQVTLFAGQWRDHFMPMLYNNKQFNAAEYDSLPSFTYTRNRPSVSFSILIIMTISTVIIVSGILGYRIRSRKKTISIA